MPSVEDLASIAEKLLRGRYGSWLNQPNEGDLCTISNTCGNLIWTDGYQLRKLLVLYTRQATGAPVQDEAMTTHHFLNLTSGVPDATWTSADYATVETAMTAFWTTIKTKYAPSTVLTSYKWYADGPAFKPHGSTVSPLLRQTAVNAPGTGTDASMPPQVAISVTEVTAAKFTVEDVEGSGTQLRNRWGRFYLPAPNSTALASPTGADGMARTGRIAIATQTSVSTAAGTLYNACRAADLIPVMYSPTTGSSWSVDEIHVDDIFDVIRTRRFDTALSRAPVVLT